MGCVVFVAFEPRGGGQPVTLCRVADRQVLVAAARQALFESRVRTGSLACEDPILGRLQADESERLERALERVIPELVDTNEPHRLDHHDLQRLDDDGAPAFDHEEAVK
jgi:hypothetical protein